MGKRTCIGCALAMVFALNCATGPEAPPRVSYRVSAKENFIKGKKALEDEDFLEAIEYFKFVKNKFPYSAFATESDLLIADCHYGRDRFIEAADAYANFIKLHPKHKRVPYATFRIGLCYHKRMPDDWWFAPPAYELDQKEVKRAIAKLQDYLERFPDDENVPEARKLLHECLTRMASWVRYVMQFNRKNGRMRGALWRADELLKVYPGTGYDEEALLVKAESLIALGEADAASTALRELITRFPKSDLLDEAEDALKELKKLPVGKAKPKREDAGPAGAEAVKPAEGKGASGP